jgi:hypothetical protein
MNTGNFKEPFSYMEYRTLCLAMGIKREWEIQLSYRIYLCYEDGNYKKGVLTQYYNNLYYAEGGFN